MKIGFVFIICLLFQQKDVNGQSLTDQLEHAQLQTNELHSFITSVLLKYRMDMSTVLTGIVTETLSHILKSLELPQLLKNDETSDELNSESVQIGKQLSLCSSQADIDIQTAIKQFFIVFNPIESESLVVLNAVVEEIAEWNSTNNPSDIVDRIHDVLVKKRNEFDVSALPALEDELRKFKNNLLLVPPSVSRCVSEALAN